MKIAEYPIKRARDKDIFESVLAYMEGVKPRETILLTAIGFASSFATPAGAPAPAIASALFASVLTASAGVNGLTCYLDREWDARMERTRNRPLPAGRIKPAERFLPFVFTLITVGLAIAYLIHPYVAAACLAGTITAVIARKTWITHYLGIVSSLAPLWMGWLAAYPRVDGALLSISFMVAVWVLIHVWSLMLAYRNDYLQAGLRIFPVTSRVEASVLWIAFLTVTLAASTAIVGVAGSFGVVYTISAAMLSIVALAASLALAISKNRESAWRVYKLSAFPFLGLIFLAMAMDRLVG